MVEAWRAIARYVGLYEVSDLGRVRSVPRVVTRRGHRLTIPGRILIGSSAGRGYRKVSLSRGGDAEGLYVHSLVLEAFVGARPDGADACHGNGDRSDNRLANLRWDSRADNHADKRLHGTDNRGTRHHRAKLSEADVIGIREAEGTLREIGKRYGIGPMQVHRIKTHQNWGHLK